MPSENIFRRHYKICSPFQMSNVHPYTIFATMHHKSTAKDNWVYSFIQKQSRYRSRVITIGLILHDSHSIKAENRTNTETLSIDL
ncbi:Uncharacterised protein [Neisseria gonorrhoeae]|nr:Uncharacterised protein [Neisseria gonorrhoeae]